MYSLIRIDFFLWNQMTKLKLPIEDVQIYNKKKECYQVDDDEEIAKNIDINKM